jgi:dimethylhistidine N-methyltransferase
MTFSNTNESEQFAASVLEGLSSDPKWLSSRYFYDDEGSRLFMEIMKLPEYYLTRSELEIFTDKANEIYHAFSGGKGTFDLVELGAGDGTKTAVLIEEFLKHSPDMKYSAIDISQEACDALLQKFRNRFPGLDMEMLNGDYFKTLDSLSGTNRRKVILFLGSNIGNFRRGDSINFFRSLRDVMKPDDLLFIGFDLQKDPRVIVNAYDDPKGVTAAFNLNLLTRINRELGGHFNVEDFSHYAVYRPIEGAARSFLMSRKKQSVSIDAFGRSFDFEAWEPVFMEISQKYNGAMIADLAAESGFEIAADFYDSRQYYCDSLWKPSGV